MAHSRVRQLDKQGREPFRRTVSGIEQPAIGQSLSLVVHGLENGLVAEAEAEIPEPCRSVDLFAPGLVIDQGSKAASDPQRGGPAGHLVGMKEDRGMFHIHPRSDAA